MINCTFLADRFSRLDVRSRLIDRARRSRRRGKPVSRFTAHLSLLEERCLMAGLEMPLAPTAQFGQYDTVGSLSAVLFTGNTDSGTVPTKTIKFFNNTDHTIYPFLYDANTGKSTAGGWYDPYDTGHEQNYRAYIGYQVTVANTTTDYLGLLPGHQISLAVPLVFWDSGRAAIATDPANFLPKSTDTSKKSDATNPFFFFYKNNNGSPTARYVAPEPDSTNTEGIVMFYHGSDPTVGPGNDAPDQLVEFTFRDKIFLTKANTPRNPIDDKALVTLVNYDVSYVDHMILPVAMEATDVPIPNTSHKDNFGWIGAKTPYTGAGSLQEAIKKFTSDTSANGLGTYFEDGTKDLGWPTFFNPTYNADTNASVGIKIPSGSSLFQDSPLGDHRSPYLLPPPYGSNNHWTLSSGGSEPIQFGLNGTFTGPNKAVITSGKDVDDIIKMLRSGWTVTGNGNSNLGTIDHVDVQNKTVYLKGTFNIPDGTSESFVFARPVTDPYATKLRDLWYSWANYYQAQFATFKPTTLTATVSTDTDNGNKDYRVLTFASPQPDLAVGMAVSNSNIQFLTTILKIATISGKTYYYLSRPVPGVTSQQPMSFTFSKPQGIAFASQANIISLKFADTKAAQDYAKAFAATVYESLSVFSTAFKQDAALPKSMAIVENVIGGNVGFLPTHAPVDYVNISANVRDLIKSALRGVPDFTDTAKYPEKDWYPPPSKPEGTQTYNVFNLDPFVWFVHRELKLSGYGFSFDDDTADVEASNATSLSIAVGGLKGLSNQEQWEPSTPWGPQHCLADISQAKINGVDHTVISLKGDKSADVYNQVKATDTVNGLVGAYVSGGTIPKGTNLAGTADTKKYQFVLSGTARAHKRGAHVYWQAADDAMIPGRRKAVEKGPAALWDDDAAVPGTGFRGHHTGFRGHHAELEGLHGGQIR